jgi:hypothetical protein
MVFRIKALKQPTTPLSPEQLERIFEKRNQALTVGMVMLKAGFDIVETQCIDGLIQEHKYRFNQFRKSGNFFLSPIEAELGLKNRTDDLYDQTEIFYKLLNIPKEKYTECLLIIDGFLKGDVKFEAATK